MPLTAEETVLAGKIDLSRSHPNHAAAHEAYLKNQAPILALLRWLEDRNGIPEHWLRYWTDPACNPGRIKACREGIFERNGCSGTGIYVHPNFIRHLRYLLFGSELPDHIKLTFAREAGGTSPEAARAHWEEDFPRMMYEWKVSRSRFEPSSGGYGGERARPIRFGMNRAM